MANGRPAILAEGLEKSYGKTRALRDLQMVGRLYHLPKRKARKRADEPEILVDVSLQTLPYTVGVGSAYSLVRGL
jgi:hypothetical protein